MPLPAHVQGGGLALKERSALLVGVRHGGAVVPLLLPLWLPLTLGGRLLVELSQPRLVPLELVRLRASFPVVRGAKGHGVAAAHGPFVTPTVLLPGTVPVRHPTAIGTAANLVLLVLVVGSLLVGQVTALHLDRCKKQPADGLAVRAVLRVANTDEPVPFARPLLPDPPLVTPVPPVRLLPVAAGRPLVLLLPQPIREAHQLLVRPNGVHQVLLPPLVFHVGARGLAPSGFHRL